MNKKIIIWSLAFFFLIVLTEYAYAAVGTLDDTNLTGSRKVNRSIIIARNGVINISLYMIMSTNNGVVNASTWIEYAVNSTTGNDNNPNIGQQINTTCGTRAFKIINLYPNSTNSCSTGSTAARACVRDNRGKTGGANWKINITTADGAPVATRERFGFLVKSCNLSGIFDIASNVTRDGERRGGIFTFDKWMNITVARTLFRNTTSNEVTADRATYFANTTTPAANQTVNLSVRISNEMDISFHIFSTNVTGSWKNRTASNVRTSGAADRDFVNWSTLKINTSCAAAACTNTKKVGWRYYANDTSTLFNASSINIISPQAVVTDSCTPPGSGDWVITNTCYKSNTNINLASGGRVLILAGGLLICDRANITAAGATPIMIILGQSLTKLVTKGASNC